MRVDYVLTKEDLITYNQYIADTVPYFRRRRMIAFLLVPLICMTVATLIYLSDGKLENFGLYGLLALLWICVLRLSMKISLKSQVNRIVKLGGADGLIGTHSATLTPEGLESTSQDKSSTFFKWNGISAIETSPTQTYIFINKLTSLVIPNTAFVSDAERQTFVETARRYREEASGLSAFLEQA